MDQATENLANALCADSRLPKNTIVMIADNPVRTIRYSGSMIEGIKTMDVDFDPLKIVVVQNVDLS